MSRSLNDLLSSIVTKISLLKNYTDTFYNRFTDYYDIEADWTYPSGYTHNSNYSNFARLIGPFLYFCATTTKDSAWTTGSKKATFAYVSITDNRLDPSWISAGASTEIWGPASSAGGGVGSQYTGAVSADPINYLNRFVRVSTVSSNNTVKYNRYGNYVIYRYKYLILGE